MSCSADTNNLTKEQGRVTQGNKSLAEDIAQTFNVSKKVFKKAVGDLYKRRLITISDDGLRLV